MNDEKRLVLAVALSIAVIVGWNMFFTTPPGDLPEKPVRTAEKQQTDDRTEPYVPDERGAETPPAGETDTAPREKSPKTAGREYRTISVSTPFYELVLSEGRGTIFSFALKEYKETNKKGSPNKELVSDKMKNGLFDIRFKDDTVPGLDSAVFRADTASDDIAIEKGKKSITFSWTSRDGVVVEKVFTFDAESYLIDCDVVLKNGAGMPVNDSLVISVPVVPGEGGSRMSQFAFEGPVALVNGELIEIDRDDIEEEGTLQGSIAWAGYTDRYFLSCVIPEKKADGRVEIFKSGNVIRTDYFEHVSRLNPGQQVTCGFDCYMGPKSHRLLNSYNDSLKKAINFGWTNFLAKPLLIVMNFIHQLVPNYGIAILLLTVLIKLVFWPLGTKSYKSMNEMKKVQPLMKEIREKYKDDKQKINQEVMALYKTYKVNPLSGCLPMLVQLPIFLALYRMLYQAIELRHAPFFAWIQDLSAPDRLFHFDFAIPLMQPPYGIPVLTIIMGVTFFFQQKMMPTGTGDPTQQKIMMLMPIFLTVIFINFPAGLVLYIFANNVISMGQQYYIQKKFS